MTAPLSYSDYHFSFYIQFYDLKARSQTPLDPRIGTLQVVERFRKWSSKEIQITEVPVVALDLTKNKKEAELFPFLDPMTTRGLYAVSDFDKLHSYGTLEDLEI